MCFHSMALWAHEHEPSSASRVAVSSTWDGTEQPLTKKNTSLTADVQRDALLDGVIVGLEPLQEARLPAFARIFTAGG